MPHSYGSTNEISCVIQYNTITFQTCFNLYSEMFTFFFYIQINPYKAVATECKGLQVTLTTGTC